MIGLRRFFCLLLLLSLAVSTVSAQGIAEDSAVVCFSKTNVRQGGFFQLHVTTVTAPLLTVKFLNQSQTVKRVEEPGPVGFKAFFGRLFGKNQSRKTEGFKWILAVPCQTPPGIYPVTLEWKGSQGVTSKEYEIQVSPRTFAEERLTVSEKMVQATIADNQRAEEEAEINALLERETQKNEPPLWRGKFIEPLEGNRKTDFGVNRYVNGIDNGFHSGWDLAAPAGTEVTAINRGRVVFTGKMNVTGNTVIVHHGLNLFSLYAHLSEIAVKEGALVKRGGRIGAEGSTGLSTGPHLHLTIKVGPTPVEPGSLLYRKLGWGRREAKERR